MIRWLVVVVMVMDKVGGGLGVTVSNRPCVGQQVVIFRAAHGENVKQDQSECQTRPERTI